MIRTKSGGYGKNIVVLFNPVPEEDPDNLRAAVIYTRVFNALNDP